jgi:hypothetical protein
MSFEIRWYTSGYLQVLGRKYSSTKEVFHDLRLSKLRESS